MFTGSYYNTIDAKGRVFIPTKLRYSLGERIWLVKGIDTCLYLFTGDGWADFKDKYIANRTKKDAKARMLQRFLLGGAHELEIDRQGRINLPQDLVGYAGIEKDVAFVGCDDLIELWNAETYSKVMDPANFNPDELMRDAAETTDEG